MCVDSLYKKGCIIHFFFNTCEAMANIRQFFSTADIRPPYSRIFLILQAIQNDPIRSPTFNEIISSIEHRYLYYRLNNSATWRREMRQTLILTLASDNMVYYDLTDNRWRLTARPAIAGG
jgi:hypothetical protein